MLPFLIAHLHPTMKKIEEDTICYLLLLKKSDDVIINANDGPASSWTRRAGACVVFLHEIYRIPAARQFTLKKTYAEPTGVCVVDWN